MRDVEVLIRTPGMRPYVVCVWLPRFSLCSCMPCIVYEVPWGGDGVIEGRGHVFSPDLLPTLIRDSDRRCIKHVFKLIRI